MEPLRIENEFKITFPALQNLHFPSTPSYVNLSHLFYVFGAFVPLLFMPEVPVSWPVPPPPPLNRRLYSPVASLMTR